ncbi:MAG: PEP-CTERM sorting domain-containing protein [Akkermansiaceae bacterium]|nr:PEP-CTERM sorting domain-containing protein [Akkermansiaceae bacterium]
MKYTRLNMALTCATIPLLLAMPASAAITTSFNVDLSPTTQSFASAATSTLALNYAIDGSGNVALVADSGGASPARWNQVSNSSAGTTSSLALFNTAFTLTYSGSANAILNYNPPYNNAGTGAVLATQGQGNASALENGESITFTVSGTATAVPGFSLDLNSFSYDLRLGNGGSSFGVEDTSSFVIEQLIPNTSLDGTIDGTGISLAAGEAMTFRTISGNAGGAGLSGFDFDVNVVPEPSSTALLGLGGLTLILRRRR